MRVRPWRPKPRTPNATVFVVNAAAAAYALYEPSALRVALGVGCIAWCAVEVAKAIRELE